MISIFEIMYTGPQKPGRGGKGGWGLPLPCSRFFLKLIFYQSAMIVKLFSVIDMILCLCQFIGNVQVRANTFTGFRFIRSSRQRCSMKKGVLRNFTIFAGRHLCQSFVLIKLQVDACNFIKKEALTQVFPYEFCEISENTFFTEHFRTTASVSYSFIL